MIELSQLTKVYGEDAVAVEQAFQRSRELAEVMELERFLDRRCATLSTGQAQRVNLARALVHDPPVALLDEPTRGLDVVGAKIVFDYVQHDKLYVFGGWSIQGGEDGYWLESGCVLDLNAENTGWEKVDQPRPLRALEVIGFKGKIVLIGGLTPEDDISNKVYFFDPGTAKWSDGPAIPGMPANGNGIAACVLDDQLYIAGMDGKVNRLNSEQNGWEACAALPSPRVHHRLVSGVKSQMIVIGGASRAGHIASVDSISVEEGK